MLIGGRYRLRERLGAGGMGEVWLARDEKLDRAVAVKRLLPDPFLPSSYRQRFAAEFRLLLTLQHEHIVQLFDAVEEAGQQHLVMELVDGINLEQLVHADGTPIAAPIAAYIADCILDALDFMQALVLGGQRANIVHRDVTPQNILLSFAAGVLVSDFGVAKLKAEWKESTEVPLFIGKRSYAPPEMYETGYVDHRMDLYAVGVLLYEMLSGQRAFPIDDPLKSRDRICKGQLEALRSRAPDVSEALAVVVQTLMHRDPAARYQTAQGAREALNHAVPSAPLAKTALRELISRRFGGPRRPTGLHFSVASYQAAVRATTTTLGLGGDGVVNSTAGVPELVFEPPGKWVAEPGRPSSSPRLSPTPRTRSSERLAQRRAAETEVPRSPRSRPPTLVQGLATGVVCAAIASWFVFRDPPHGPVRATTLLAPLVSAAAPPVVPAAPVSVPAPIERRVQPSAYHTALGLLSLDSDSPANVTIDGVSLGTTPVHDYPLSPGRYTLDIVDVASGARRSQVLRMTRRSMRLRL